MKNSHNKTETELTLLQTLGSILAAIGGVQSMQNLRRDFRSNSAWKIIAVGITVTVVFVMLIILAARYAAV